MAGLALKDISKIYPGTEDGPGREEENRSAKDLGGAGGSEEVMRLFDADTGGNLL